MLVSLKVCTKFCVAELLKSHPTDSWRGVKVGGKSMFEMFKESKAEDVIQGLSREDREEMDLKGTRRENQKDSN